MVFMSTIKMGIKKIIVLITWNISRLVKILSMLLLLGLNHLVKNIGKAGKLTAPMDTNIALRIRSHRILGSLIVFADNVHWIGNIVQNLGENIKIKLI